MMDLHEYKLSLANNESILATSRAILRSYFDDSSLFTDLWANGIIAPSYPTSPVVCNKSTSQSLNRLTNFGNNRVICVGGQVSEKNGELKTFVLIDMLSHQGGLNTFLTSPITTNFPTAALTRYVDGVGVFAALVAYDSGVGMNGRTLTISYTNTNNISGKTGVLTPASFIDYNGLSGTNLGRFGIFSLESGDLGVKSVESFSYSGSTSGTNINRCGILLFKPLAMIGSRNIISNGQSGFCTGKLLGGLATVDKDACLSVIGRWGDNSHQSMSDSINFENECVRCSFHLYEINNEPDPVNWSNITWYNAVGYGTITSKLITGLVDPINLKIIDAITSPDISLWYQVTNSEITGDQLTVPAGPTWTQVSASPGTTFSVSNGQWVSFCCHGTSVTSSQTVSVLNADRSDAVIDTFTIQIDK